MPSLAKYVDRPSTLPDTLVATLATPPDESCSFRKLHALDADQHAENLGRWQQTYDQLSLGRFSGMLGEIWLGDIQIFRETTNQSVIEHGRAWDGAGTFGIPLAMDGTALFCDQPLDMNGMLSFGPGFDFALRTPREFDIVGISLNADCYNSIIATVDDVAAVPAASRGQPRVLRCSAQLSELRSFLFDLFDALDANPARLEAPQIQKTLRSALIGYLYASLQSARQTPPPLSSFQARKRVVERARLHVLSNLHEPVTIAELCEQIGVSRRTLQYCFQEILDTNPVHYLRAMRLNSVRRELRQATPERLQIQDVAARWGFWHLSHFANDYRAMFGELPSETLRRSA